MANGEPCLTDEYGDPTKHCTARSGCSQHVGYGELTCARCIGRVRSNLRRIVELTALMLPATVEAGSVNSEAANLAGPGADYSTLVARRRIGQKWIEANLPERTQIRASAALLEDDDEHHAYNVLGRWDMMIREDYDHPSDKRVTIANAADYLERQLGRIAQDEGQDFPLFAKEIRKCARHLSAVLATAARPERGAPCPECTDDETGVGPRLVRQYGHWCDSESCCKVHIADDSGDEWACPRDDGHRWPHADYERWIEERQATRVT
jgi:hypothetical protein